MRGAIKVPDILKIEGVRSGKAMRRNTNSTLNIRVDYQNKEGDYVKSVLYHEGVYTKGRSFILPWGTKQAPDEIVEVENLNDFSLDIATHKPENFSGRVLISFEMQAIGTGVKQNFQLSRGTSTLVEELPEDNKQTEDCQSNSPSTIYNLSGQHLPCLVPGINIVRNHNGCARKVYIK